MAGTLWRTRTVEGDLGVRWNAPGVVEAAAAERLIAPAEQDGLTAAAAIRTTDPGFVPSTVDEQELDVRLAELATTVALRRHARPERARPTGAAVLRAGKDLREVRLVVGSGGVLRHAVRPARKPSSPPCCPTMPVAGCCRAIPPA